MSASEQAMCALCGEPMPPGEEMFNYHGYSGPCPKPPIGSGTMVGSEASTDTAQERSAEEKIFNLEASLLTAQQEIKRLQDEHYAEQVLLATMCGEPTAHARIYSVINLAHLIAERAAKAERAQAAAEAERDAARQALQTRTAGPTDPQRP